MDVDAGRSRFVPVNGVNLHVKEFGPADGRPVLLLHGFPEFWWGWRKQLGPLAEAGFRVWAPDQRGYNLSDKPLGIAAYTQDVLADDAAGLLQAMGGPAALVGHDWGAAIAWRVAVRYPHLVSRLVAMDVPHPTVMDAALRHDPRQLLRSWYVFALQVPRLPERQLQADGFRRLVGQLRSGAKAGSFSEAEVEEYRRAWSQPGALRAMLSWYRAAVRRRVRSAVPSRAQRRVVRPRSAGGRGGRHSLAASRGVWFGQPAPARVLRIAGGTDRALSIAARGPATARGRAPVRAARRSHRGRPH